MDDTNNDNVQQVTKTDLLGLSWERERTSDELLGFIARREAALSTKQQD